MNRAATFALAPLSAIYRLVIAARNAFYDLGLFRTRDVGRPVISIGNLTTGGTGKTPLVEWVARELADSGLRVCILTRGYGRASAGRVLVSDADRIIADVAAAGDEPFLLAEKLRGLAAVVCDTDRVAGAEWAIENLGSDVFVLDDGFQHRRIARQLDVLVIDATNAWGNKYVLPAGSLREPINSIARADCVVITRTDADSATPLLNEITKIRSDIPVSCSVMKHVTLQRAGAKDACDPTKIPSQPSLAFCGIGNPEAFFSLLSDAGYHVLHTRIFRDHHRYTQADIDQLVHDARSRGIQTLLTTAKDEVKIRSLNFALPCYAVEIEVELDREDKLRDLIRRAVSRA